MGGIAEAAPDKPAAHTTGTRRPLEVTFGDSGSFYVLYCTRCPDMPLESWFDFA